MNPEGKKMNIVLPKNLERIQIINNPAGSMDHASLERHPKPFSKVTTKFAQIHHQ